MKNCDQHKLQRSVPNGTPTKVYLGSTDMLLRSNFKIDFLNLITLPYGTLGSVQHVP